MFVLIVYTITVAFVAGIRSIVRSEDITDAIILAVFWPISLFFLILKIITMMGEKLGQKLLKAWTAFEGWANK